MTRDYSNMTQVEQTYQMVQIEGLEQVSPALTEAIKEYIDWHQQQREEDSTLLKRTSEAGWLLWNECLGNMERYRELGDVTNERILTYSLEVAARLQDGMLEVVSPDSKTYLWNRTDAVGQEDYLASIAYEVPDMLSGLTERVGMMQAGIKMAQGIMKGMEAELRRLTLLQAVAGALHDEVNTVMEKNADNPVMDSYTRTFTVVNKTGFTSQTGKTEKLEQAVEILLTPAPVMETEVDADEFIATVMEKVNKEHEQAQVKIQVNKIAYAERVIEIALEAKAKEEAKKAERERKAAERKAAKATAK